MVSEDLLDFISYGLLTKSHYAHLPGDIRLLEGRDCTTLFMGFPLDYSRSLINVHTPELTYNLPVTPFALS